MKVENSEIKKINSHIEQLFKEWKNLQPLKKENQERFDKKVRLDWNFHSNKIEGNTLTYGETELLLIFGRHDGGHPQKDYLEMQAHDVAITRIKDLTKNKEHYLTEADIRDLNKIILKEPFWTKAQTPDGSPTKKKIIPGEYKKQPNHVKTRTGEIFKFAEPNEVPPKMDDLVKWLCKEIKNPTLSIASFLGELHHRFILIHPFDDGNGRIVRLLINYILLKLDYPPLVIQSNDRENYLIAINRADTGDINALSAYIGKVLIFWLELGIKAARGQDISQPGDVDKEVTSFIKEQRSKGLNKYFSKESAIHLIDNLFDNLVETFKNKFTDFNELFDSKRIEQTLLKPDENFAKDMFKYSMGESHIDPRGPEYEYHGILSDEFIEKEDLKKQIELLKTHPFSFTGSDTSYLEILITLSYNLYRGQEAKELTPFNMQTKLQLTMDKYQYKIGIISTSDSINNEKKKIIEEKYYHQILTQEEINKFIEKGKKDFFSLLKKSTKEKQDSEDTLL